MNIVVVEEYFVKDKNNHIKVALWLHELQNNHYEIKSTLPPIVQKKIAKSNNLSKKLKFADKKNAKKAFRIIAKYINANQQIVNDFGYNDEITITDAHCYFFAEVYRQEFTRPRTLLASINYSVYHFHKFSQHYMAFKQFHPNKLNKKLRKITRMEFETKLILMHQKNEYVDVYNYAAKFYKWTDFYFDVYIVENKEGKPILFVFY
jgi:hypothetical protein